MSEPSKIDEAILTERIRILNVVLVTAKQAKDHSWGVDHVIEFLKSAIKINEERPMSDINWPDLPSWVNFVATDDDGHRNGFDEKPSLSSGSWYVVMNRHCYIDRVAIATFVTERSLIERPNQIEELSNVTEAHTKRAEKESS